MRYRKLTPREETERLATRLAVPFHDAAMLRRCEKTLHRWAEGECGDSNGWSIERDEATGKPFQTRYSDRHHMTRLTYPIPDRERGALQRIATVAARNGFHWYNQTDPRGCALYVAREPLTDTNYSSVGVAV